MIVIGSPVTFFSPFVERIDYLLVISSEVYYFRPLTDGVCLLQRLSEKRDSV